jgi:hypothetical protein
MNLIMGRNGEAMHANIFNYMVDDFNTPKLIRVCQHLEYRNYTFIHRISSEIACLERDSTMVGKTRSPYHGLL